MLGCSDRPSSDPKRAQQGARANADSRHAACYRHEEFEYQACCCTRRAGCQRGSSLTLGIMKRVAAIAFAATLALASCSDRSPPVLPARKEALRKILDPKFTFSLPAKEVEEELYRVLEAFAEGRRADEFVRELEFTSRSEARLSFSDSGMHGGGSATLRKERGRWTVVTKLHFL